MAKIAYKWNPAEARFDECFVIDSAYSNIDERKGRRKVFKNMRCAKCNGYLSRSIWRLSTQLHDTRGVGSRYSRRYYVCMTCSVAEMFENQKYLPGVNYDDVYSQVIHRELDRYDRYIASKS